MAYASAGQARNVLEKVVLIGVKHLELLKF